MPRRPRAATLGWLAVAVLLAGCSLSAPPPERGNAPLISPAPEQTVAVALPSRRPSAANGAILYAEKCVGCHGASGRGDGPQAARIQSQFGAAPANLTSDRIARALTPAEWFAAVTGGNIERGMPGFGEGFNQLGVPLSADQIWDVIVYAWTLAVPDDSLALGQAVYAERCASCHGETGRGDGPHAEGPLPDFMALASFRDAAPGAWDSALETSHIPTFAGRLSGAERSAVNDYVRSFAYDAASASAAERPAVTPAGTPGSASQTPIQATVTIAGEVINGTAGGPTPAGLEGTFYHFPGGLDSAPVTQTLTFDADGRFTIKDLDAQPGDVVAAAVQYGGVPYFSEPIAIDESTSILPLSLPVYEQTRESGAIHVDALHIIAEQQGDGLSVVEVYLLSNLGDRTVANTSGDGEPALRFHLPANAGGFIGMTDTPGVYLPSPQGFNYHEAIRPGSRTAQLQISYEVPLDGNATLDRVLAYPTNSVNILVRGSDLQPSGDQLTSQGLTEFDGQVFQVYGGGPFGASDTLTLRIAPPSAGLDAKLVAGAIILVAGAGAVLYGVWRMRRPEPEPQPQARRVTRRPAPSAQAELDQILDQIAALDDAFEAGEIEAVAYRQQRDALKAKAVRLTRRA